MKTQAMWWSVLALALGAMLSIGFDTHTAQAQRGDSRSSDSRGGDSRSDRDRGSSDRDRDRGSDRGSSDRGSSSDRSRFGGGFPGGGFPGGGPPGGFSGGGFGGGPPGGGFGGPPGGFSPVDMLRRFDRNNNNMIDMDEREGPARFFIERLAQNNSRIDINRPIPLDRLAAEMDRMRQDRGGGGPPGSSSSSSTPTKPAEPEPLVPGFDKIEEMPPVPGFGVPDPNASIKVEERDIREADERLKRYDSNKDGVLSKEELQRGRWSEDPMQFDRNGDGKLNKNELAVRYAKRRLADQGEQGRGSNGSNNNDSRSRFTGSSSGYSPWGSSSWGSRGGDSRGGDSRGGDSRGGDRGDSGGWGSREGSERDGNRSEKKEEPKSYRTASAKDKANSVKGLPDWFARSDADGDGQVLMSEYSTTWTDEKVAEFAKYDLNSDGIITSRECLNALKSGSPPNSVAIASSNPATSASSSSTSIVAPSGTPPEDVNRAWAKRQIERYDKNKDGQLTVDEWSSMVVPPDGADVNKDGIITIDEYVKFRSGPK